MNLLQAQGHTFGEGEEKSSRASLDSSNSSSSSPMLEDGTASDRKVLAALSAHASARDIIRLIQCSHCSKPFSSPVTLPCGHAVCRTCLPEQQPRENISYPNTPGRVNGIQCRECEVVHASGECNVDVTLTKIMESVDSIMAEDALAQNCRMEIQEIPAQNTTSNSEKSPEPHSWELIGGRLRATFNLAQQGFLRRDLDLEYRVLEPSDKECENLDINLLHQLRDSAYKELDCQVCYNMMLDPVTTPCGHSFCRKCLARVLDHSRHCPFCRRTLPIPPSLSNRPSNAALSSLLNGLCPELVAARAEAVALEELGTGDSTIPLFVCTLSFPNMPTFLHIFEPRYRLMLRRALESNRRFGMVMYNNRGAPQGELGSCQFTQYGTLLEIINFQYESDGRCYVETRGVGRFRVTSHGTLDGYITGSVERIDDMSLAEEEQREATEIAAAAAVGAANSAQGIGVEANYPVDLETELSSLSTRDLLLQGLEFIESMRTMSATWLSERIVEAYGGPPDDPAIFPYWFASVLPISEDEKYVLLHMTSVRERLKITIRWIRRIQSSRWWVLLHSHYQRSRDQSTGSTSSENP